MKEEKEETRTTQAVPLSVVGREMLGEENDQRTQVEQIKKSPDIGDEQKENLLKTLEDVDTKIMKPTGEDISIERENKRENFIKNGRLNTKNQRGAQEKSEKKDEQRNQTDIKEK